MEDSNPGHPIDLQGWCYGALISGQLFSKKLARGYGGGGINTSKLDWVEGVLLVAVITLPS